MTAPQSNGSRWFPSPAQLKDPQTTEVAFRQMLTQLYALVDRVTALESAAAAKGPQGAK